MADSILNRIATGERYIDLEGPNTFTSGLMSIPATYRLPCAVRSIPCTCSRAWRQSLRACGLGIQQQIAVGPRPRPLAGPLEQSAALGHHGVHLVPGADGGGAVAHGYRPVAVLHALRRTRVVRHPGAREVPLQPGARHAEEKVRVGRAVPSLELDVLQLEEDSVLFGTVEDELPRKCSPKILDPRRHVIVYIDLEHEGIVLIERDVSAGDALVDIAVHQTVQSRQAKRND